MCILDAISHRAKTYKKTTENRKYYRSRAKGLISSELIRKAFFSRTPRTDTSKGCYNTLSRCFYIPLYIERCVPLANKLKTII